jgi:hypothetical protein
VLQGEPYVGSNAIQRTSYQGGTPPHTETLVTLQGTVSVGGEQGMVIVKNYYAPGTEEAAIFADPTAGLIMISVMFQRAASYDPDNQDWFWVGYMPNGALTQNNGMVMAGKFEKGMETGCIFAIPTPLAVTFWSCTTVFRCGNPLI